MQIQPIEKAHNPEIRKIDGTEQKQLNFNKEAKAVEFSNRQKQSENTFAEEINDIEKVQEATDKVNEIILHNDARHEFQVHEGTGRIMVKLVDKESGEVIKEIPSEKMLDVAAKIWDLVGLVVDEKG
jgi:flagellar protein FlaG